MLSKEALIRMFFCAIGLHSIKDKIALLYSNNEELIEYFIAENVQEKFPGESLPKLPMG